MNAVVRIDRDAEDRAWAESRFDAIASEFTTVWETAKEIEANWEEGHEISRFYPDQTAAMVMRERVQNLHYLDGRSMRLMYVRFNGARARRLAPPEHQNHPPSIYDFFRAQADEKDIARAFEKAEKLRGGIITRNMRIATGMGATARPPYWNLVIDALMYGEHDLSPAIARNIIATAQKWLQDNPDAPTRR